MRILVLALALFGLALTSYGQNIYQIRADSVRIYNDCDTAEFILENHTQMVPGYLYNRGRGRTEFRRLRLFDLGGGLISIGDQDTLDMGKVVSGIGGGNSSTAYIKNQKDSAQVANYRINGSGTQKNLTFNQDVTSPAPLMMLGNGDTLLKAGGNSMFMGPKSGLTLGASADANTAFGYNAMSSPTNAANAAFGTNAMSSLTSGKWNVAVGAYALNTLTTGSANVAIGAYAGYNMNAKELSIGIGYRAMYNGGGGIGIGYLAMENATGSGIAIGNFAMQTSTTAIGNIGIGTSALSGLTTGSNNIAIGNTSGTTTGSGTYNIFLGSLNQAMDTSNNVTVIGNKLKLYKLSNVVLLGNYTQNVVIGPNLSRKGTATWDTLSVDTGDKLQVNGSAYIAGKVKLPSYNNINGDSVLTTDALGNLVFTSKGGGSSTTNTVANLQNVTDTGNVTRNAIVITGHDKLPDTTAGMEMSVDTSDEYNSSGLRANIKVYDHNTYTPGHLYVNGKGLMVENPDNFTHRVRMHPEQNGFYMDAEYKMEGYSWYQNGSMYLNTSPTSHTIIGSSGDGDYSVNINGALATRVERSRNIASDYMARDAVTYLIVDNTTTTIKMYEPTFCPNRIVTIKKTVNTTTPIKIIIDGAGLIDGQTSITITDYLASVQLQSDGTNYWILYRYKN